MEDKPAQHSLCLKKTWLYFIIIKYESSLKSYRNNRFTIFIKDDKDTIQEENKIKKKKKLTKSKLSKG